MEIAGYFETCVLTYHTT